jgi:hypothetical protein
VGVRVGPTELVQYDEAGAVAGPRPALGRAPGKLGPDLPVDHRHRMLRRVDLMEADQANTGVVRPVQHLRHSGGRLGQRLVPLPARPHRLDLRPRNVGPQQELDLRVTFRGQPKVLPELATRSPSFVIVERSTEPETVVQVRDLPTLPPLAMSSGDDRSQRHPAGPALQPLRLQLRPSRGRRPPQIDQLEER